MKHVCYTIIFLISSLVSFSCCALGLFDAARDTVEGAARITEDAVDTTGDVVEDVLTPGRRREGMYQGMPVEGEPYPENDDVYIPQSPQRAYQDE